jgi:four helix bundle protein
MATITRFEDLQLWQQARALAKEIYFLTETPTLMKEFRFKEQIKSSSGSIADNIAEGFEREGTKEFIQFLYIAKGSAGEMRSQLHRAFDANLINESAYNNLIKEATDISTSISNFINYLKKADFKGNKYK